jgi:uncharacterized membrane protein YbhN (UPF0104 family)
LNQYARKIIGRKRTIVALIVSVVILVILAFKTNVRVEQIGIELEHVDWAILAAAVVFSAGWHIFVGADKWYRILRALGAPVSYGEVLRVRLGSDPIRFASPLKVGEIVNAAYFARIRTFGFSRAAGSIAFDKVLNLFGTLVWLYVGFVALMQMPPMRQLAMHVAVGVAAIIVIAARPVRELFMRIGEAIHPKIGRLTRGLLSGFEEFSPARKVGFLLYGTVFQLRPLILCYLIFLAFSPSQMPSMAEVIAYASVAVLMGNAPFTAAGIGARETAIVLFFSGYGSDAMLFSVGLLMSFAIHIAPAIVGIPFMVPLLKAVTTVLPGGSEASAGEAVTEPAASPAVVTPDAAVPGAAKE